MKRDQLLCEASRKDLAHANCTLFFTSRAAFVCKKKTRSFRVFPLRRLKLHGIKRQKVPKIHGLKKHQKNHSLACKKSSRFWNTKRTLM